MHILLLYWVSELVAKPKLGALLRVNIECIYGDIAVYDFPMILFIWLA